jgi:hypothetical protein
MPCLRASLVGYLMVRLLLAARPERVCTAAGSQWSPPHVWWGVGRTCQNHQLRFFLRNCEAPMTRVSRYRRRFKTKPKTGRKTHWRSHAKSTYELLALIKTICLDYYSCYQGRIHNVGNVDHGPTAPPQFGLFISIFYIYYKIQKYKVYKTKIDKHQVQHIIPLTNPQGLAHHLGRDLCRLKYRLRNSSTARP